MGSLLKQIDTYMPEEFVAECANRGYCSRALAERYVRNTGKETLTEADMVEAYRLGESRRERYSAILQPRGTIRTTRDWKEEDK